MCSRCQRAPPGRAGCNVGEARHPSEMPSGTRATTSRSVFHSFLAVSPVLAGAMLAPAACSPGALGAPPASTTLTVEGGVIEVEFGAGHFDLSRAELMAWVSSGASAVVGYFGRFPVARYRVVIRPVPDETGVLGGTTWAIGGAR